jgi:hypothetical protein
MSAEKTEGSKFYIVPVPRDQDLLSDFVEVAHANNITPEVVRDKLIKLTSIILYSEQKDRSMALQFVGPKGTEPMEKLLTLRSVLDDPGDPNVWSLRELEELFPTPKKAFPTPKEEAEWVLEEYKRDGVDLRVSDQSYQLQAKEEVKKVTDQVVNTYAGKVPDESLSWLEDIEDGVVVVENLNSIIPRSSSGLYSDKGEHWLERLSKKFLERFGVKIRVYGNSQVCGNIRPLYRTLLLDESIFTKLPQTERLNTIAHEECHLISADPELPYLLLEAATDIYAEKALGYSANSKDRMSDNFRRTHGLWRWIEGLAGEQLALDGYVKPSIEEITVINGVISNIHLFDNTLHTFMQERLGQDHNGTFQWDRIMTLIYHKKIMEAEKVARQFS